jgi:hypothetical protein
MDTFSLINNSSNAAEVDEASTRDYISGLPNDRVKNSRKEQLRAPEDDEPRRFEIRKI